MNFQQHLLVISSWFWLKKLKNLTIWILFEITGRLVTTLIQKTGDHLGENLEHLLKAVLSKLKGSSTLSVIQSLIMVYAQLVHRWVSKQQ